MVSVIAQVKNKNFAAAQETSLDRPGIQTGRQVGFSHSTSHPYPCSSSCLDSSSAMRRERKMKSRMASAQAMTR